MHAFNQKLLTAAVFTVLGITGLFMNSRQAEAQNPFPGAAPVNIVSPLPLPVSISGTPTINLTNTAANPLIVRDVDNPARRPFQIILCSQSSASHTFCSHPVIGAPGASSSFAVSPNQRLVLRFTSGICLASTGATDNLNVNLKTTVGGATVAYPIFPVNTQFPFWGTTQEVYISADPGTTVSLETLSASANASLDCKFSLSGYTVTP